MRKGRKTNNGSRLKENSNNWKKETEQIYCQKQLKVKIIKRTKFFRNYRERKNKRKNCLRKTKRKSYSQLNRKDKKMNSSYKKEEKLCNINRN